MSDAQPASDPGRADFADEGELVARLDRAGYLVDPGMGTALHLSMQLGLPLLLEGEPGVGKTSAAKALAQALGTELIRLQCYEGLSVSESLYEWNYQRQLLAIRLAEARHERLDDADLFTEEFLQERPILKAVRRSAQRPVLLIDEIDRADDEFEALLLEFLGEWSVTVPELGTFVAEQAPVVVLTSNRSRDLHDALRRRCLYHWIEFPAAEQVADILRRHVPSASASLIGSVTEFVGRVRRLDLDKAPGMAEAIDWLSALVALNAGDLVADQAARTLGALAKTPDDRELIAAELARADVEPAGGANQNSA
jgi:MoxR-like ATPase